MKKILLDLEEYKELKLESTKYKQSLSAISEVMELKVMDNDVDVVVDKNALVMSILPYLINTKVIKGLTIS